MPCRVFLPTFIKIGEVDEFRLQRVEPPKNEHYIYHGRKRFVIS